MGPLAGFEVRPCRFGERRDALELLYRPYRPWARRQAIRELLQDSRRGQVDLSGLWVARRLLDQRLVGVALTQALAGHTAAIWPPEVSLRWYWQRRRVASALITEALDDLSVRGFEVAQALLDPNGPRRAGADLKRAGLRHVTDLVHLQRGVDIAIATTHSGTDWRWSNFSQEGAFRFRQALEATYAESLDMPELSQVRSLEDLLAGHQAQDRFDPALWRVGRLPKEPEALVVLLMGRIPDRGLMEVTYLGLSPTARGRGLGRAALAEAIQTAGDEPNVQAVQLAVDLRNHPACRLYESTGFVPIDRKQVYLKLLGKTSTSRDLPRSPV